MAQVTGNGFVRIPSDQALVDASPAVFPVLSRIAEAKCHIQCLLFSDAPPYPNGTFPPAEFNKPLLQLQIFIS